MSRRSNIHITPLFASAFAAIILAAGTLSVTPAFADSCRYLEEPELGNCLLRKAYKQHELNTEIEEECARGGCGRKANKLQERADDNAANMRRYTPNSNKTNSGKTRRWGGPAD
jgi:hypothetical protein